MSFVGPIPTPRILNRLSSGDADFWRLRELLVETVALAPLGFNWDVRRLDGMRFYEADEGLIARWEQAIQLWETENGRLVGALHGGGGGEVYHQLHPDYRQIEDEMIAWAEAHLAAPEGAGRPPELSFYAYEYDTPRQRVLRKRGYAPKSEDSLIRRLCFEEGLALPAVAIAQGYTLRKTDPEDERDCEQIAGLLNTAFGRDFHNPAEYRNFTRLAPSFHPDLDLVAVAPDGAFAAYVGVPYDKANRMGIFEPVCTHPNHRRKGLARALMIEGLRRLQAIGAADVTVETGARMAANHLYDTIGFTEVYMGFVWRRG
jgi:ribosomal protein S18 acetylase RimI-like enzyme